MRLATLAATCVAVLTASAAIAQPQTVLYPGGAGQPLLDAILADYAPTLTLGYNPARDSLYAYEQRTDGALCGVYTRFCIQLNPNADPSTDAFNKGVNAEHTWPQSMGAGSEPQKSDLHHLFPAKANVNSSRNNHPYGEIPDGQTDGWYREDQSQSSIPTVFVDEWSEKDNDHPDPAWEGRFEPRHDHKGNAARAAFYFRAVYPAAVASAGSQPFFDVMKDDLIVWHYSDPVDLEEYARSAWIASLQGTPNPFILDSTLARRAFDLSGAPVGAGGGATGDVWVNEIHYDNNGSDVGEGVEIAGPAGASLAGWTIVRYNGNGGGAYGTTALSGTIPDQQGGYGTVWVPISGLQNGSPDGVALVDGSGAVVQFLSYEGAFTASDGAASGQASTDIGVAETSTSTVGWSLQVGGTGTEAGDFAWETAQAATPGAPNANQILGDGSASVVAWVNEIHYDNSGSDRDEGIEIAGTAGLDLAGWSVALYNGSNGTVYGTLVLSGVIDDEGVGLGALWFAQSGLQNGAPDGLALVDADGAVVEFWSYEGVVTAVDGPASGLTSTDLGVAETSSTPLGRALQRTGTGSTGDDFAWSAPQQHTRGSVNQGQTFVGAGARQVSGEEGPASNLIEVTLYPNPTRGRTTVALKLAAPSEVTADVFDMLGRQVATVEGGPLGEGFQSLDLGLDALPSGAYVVRIVAGLSVSTQTLTIVR